MTVITDLTDVYYKFYVSSHHIPHHSGRLADRDDILLWLFPLQDETVLLGSSITQVRLDALTSDERIAPTETLLDICGRIEAVFSFLTVLTLGVVAVHYNR